MFGLSKKSSDLWMFVGLGNPGGEHAKNRHNIGFMAIDAMADEYRLPAFKSKYKGEMAEGKIGDRKIVFLKPQTYMNLSGQSVSAAAKFYKIPVEQIVVFYDEIELPLAKLRVKQGGGNAGHNGLRSLDDYMPSKNYWRVRLGVGRPEHGDVADYVLGNFSKNDMPLVEDLVAQVSKNVSFLLDGKDSEFMNKVTLGMKKD